MKESRFVVGDENGSGCKKQAGKAEVKFGVSILEITLPEKVMPRCSQTLTVLLYTKCWCKFTVSVYMGVGSRGRPVSMVQI